MPKEKQVRIRRSTYESLSNVADEMELTIGELTDRVLSKFLDEYEEENNEDVSEEDEDYGEDEEEEDDEDDFD
jgi:hypothetical protein